MKKVAIQGTLGSYHDIAALKYFEGEEIELIVMQSSLQFAEVVEEELIARIKHFGKTEHVVSITGLRSLNVVQHGHTGAHRPPERRTRQAGPEI